MNPIGAVDAAAQSYQEARSTHWNAIASKRDAWSGWGGSYRRRLQQIYRFLVNADSRVLEIGCGTADLLGCLQPSLGVGVDFSPEMLKHARKKHPGLRFIQADVVDLSTIDGPFDVVIFSDLVNDLWDVQRSFEELPRLCTPSTRIILNFHSGLWQLPLTIAQRLGLATPMLPQNWLTPEDVRGMLGLAGFEVIRSWHEVLWPFPLGGMANKFLVRLWPFKEFALSNFMIARLQPQRMPEDPMVSIVIPARNEAGNIQAIFDRTPCMGQATELIFVEGHSRDDTFAAINGKLRHIRTLAAACCVNQASGKLMPSGLALPRLKATR